MTISCNTPEVSRLNQDLALEYIITWHPVKTLEINQPSILFQDETEKTLTQTCTNKSGSLGA